MRLERTSHVLRLTDIILMNIGRLEVNVMGLVVN